MKIKNKASPFSNISDEQVKLFGFDDYDYQIKVNSPKDKSIF